MTTQDIGRMVEIRPAYSMDTDSQSVWDEIAGCCGWITKINRDNTVDVQIKNGDEINIACTRIRFIGGVE